MNIAVKILSRKTTWQTRKWCTTCWARAVTLGLKNSKQLRPRWKKSMDYILGHFLPLLIANSVQLQITPCWGHLDNRFPKCDALGTPLLQLLASDISTWTNRPSSWHRRLFSYIHLSQRISCSVQSYHWGTPDLFHYRYFCMKSWDTKEWQITLVAHKFHLKVGWSNLIVPKLSFLPQIEPTTENL